MISVSFSFVRNSNCIDLLSTFLEMSSRIDRLMRISHPHELVDLCKEFTDGAFFHFRYKLPGFSSYDLPLHDFEHQFFCAPAFNSVLDFDPVLICYRHIRTVSPFIITNRGAEGVIHCCSCIISVAKESIQAGPNFLHLPASIRPKLILLKSSTTQDLG